jgi:hypothetical protein
MKGISKFIFGTVIVTAMAASLASASTPIVYYSFNNIGLLDGTSAGTNAFLAADIGSSISTFTTFTTGTGVLSLPTGGSLNLQPSYVAGNSVSWNNWGNGTNRYYQFTLDSTGYQGVLLSWEAQRSSNGPRSNELWYSTDGGANFSLFAENVLPTASVYTLFTNDLSTITALDNNPSVVFRLYPLNTGGAGGTYRVDNLTINATVIPEPSTVLLAGVGLASLIALRRRRA